MEIKNLSHRRQKNLQTATFAGGCFWCTEAAFQKIPGVEKVVSGFTGGTEENPDYYAVASGKTGHREGIQVTFDPTQISYEELLWHFWQNIDPTDPGGQFFDRGKQYATAILYHDEGQRKAAEKSKEQLTAAKIFAEPLTTEILEFQNFFPAEAAHQNYACKNPIRYNAYSVGSGREAYFQNLQAKFPPFSKKS